MQQASREITKLNLDIQRFDRDHIPADRAFHPGRINVLDLANIDPGHFDHGKISATCGKAAYEYIETAIQLAMEGKINGTVTAPIHKEALDRAGIRYAGHTEIYASLTGTKDYAMMLADGDFRVIHVSTHVSLREAIELVKKERILAVIRLAWDMLHRIGIVNPRIAVAGLNPHASDGGLFGTEEQREIAPAIAEARSLGMQVDGPLPPDTCFSSTLGGQFDVAVAMYHDQGHIPVKVKGFHWDNKQNMWTSVSGINITLGLPIIRTSVDHGVAFGKAGKGTASEDSMTAAIELAAKLAVS
jgi:4-hydroxythreonine-4-phosphate dehydrogenase